MKIDKTTKIQIVIVAFLVMIIAAMYLNTLETRSISYDDPYQNIVYRTEYYQDNVYRTEYYQEPVYRTDYYMEKEPYTETVSSTGSVSYKVNPGVCDDNGRMWLGTRKRVGISQYQLINTDTVTGSFTLYVGMFLSDGTKVGQQITKNIVAGGSDFFEYRLDISENITCTYDVMSALSTETNVVTKYNDVQKSKQNIDHYETKSKQVFDRFETKSKQVFDHYETKYRTLYKDVTKERYLWLMGS